jgi:hypothetical protein
MFSIAARGFLSNCSKSLFVGALAMAIPGVAAAQMNGPLSLASEGSFFIGGQNETTNGLSYPPTTNATWTLYQMYVQYQRPAKVSHLPITLIHGCCLTGKTWETTPDGRMGWYEYFTRQHYPTYMVDQVFRGRSGFDPSTINQVKGGLLPPSALLTEFTAGHELAWTIFRFGLTYPNAFPGIQYPMQAAAPNGEFWKQMVPDLNGALPQPNPTLTNLSQLSINLAGTVLLSHSESGIFPFQTAGINTQGIAGIVAVEPGQCTNLNASAVAKIPSLILYGDYVSQFPNWAASLAACTAFAAQVTALGGDITVLQLPNIGIHGNSHMMMQDLNNLQVAHVINDWIVQHVENTTQGKAYLASSQKAFK